MLELLYRSMGVMTLYALTVPVLGTSYHIIYHLWHRLCHREKWTRFEKIRDRPSYRLFQMEIHMSIIYTFNWLLRGRVGLIEAIRDIHRYYDYYMELSDDYVSESRLLNSAFQTFSGANSWFTVVLKARELDPSLVDFWLSTIVKRLPMSTLTGSMSSLVRRSTPPSEVASDYEVTPEE